MWLIWSAEITTWRIYVEYKEKQISFSETKGEHSNVYLKDWNCSMIQHIFLY